jgi:Ca2+-binding RTX toxin-like protein
VVTQDFGARFGYQAQFVGVCYEDSDANDFYSMGEGSGGITVAIAGAGTTVTQSAGGYAVIAPSGVNTVTFSGGGLPAAVSVDVAFGAQNVKVDLVDGDTIRSSADATLGEGALNLNLLGQFATTGTGNVAENILHGNAQANLLAGLQGADSLFGGDGNDTLKGNAGRDELRGGVGDDAAYGGVGADRIFADAGNDLVRGHKGSDELHGGVGQDLIYGDRHSDTLFGEGGDDVLRGGLHNDRLFGGAGRDDLAGQGGLDILSGGGGDDTLTGGAGDDTFVFEPGFGSDVIMDFHAGADGVDVLDFSALGIALADLDVLDQAGSSLITTPAGDSVLLTGVLPGELDGLTDFLF